MFISCRQRHHLHVYKGDNCTMLLMYLIPYQTEDPYFRLGMLRDLCRDAVSPLSNDPIFFRGKDPHGELGAQFNLLVQAVASTCNNPNQVRIVDLLLSACLLKMALQQNTKKNNYQSRYVEKAIIYIEKNLCRPFMIANIAAFVGVHPSYLSRIFKEKVGLTIVDYVHKLRIESARLQLENTCNSVLDIALECGFSNRQHFTRCFKKIEGISPEEYKHKYRRNEQKSVYIKTDRMLSMRE